ncbi:hypothetical protein CTAYLR_004489 [Chrysophaeum taylorii]|uniref:F-box/LRR-repeat protein 15-like leucin rich repeat domain-containing protein n=1 Tax=Chrysophaeum taylorii TaxID=2483200 RepID=A0AAD7UC63_9STRA|nr:hypothetical protein CTAYLR_004489 [Chrysophaeum taylorii]
MLVAIDDEAKWRATRPPKIRKIDKLDKLVPVVVDQHHRQDKEVIDLTAGLQMLKEPGELKKKRGLVGPSVFERESPRAKATLRALLCEFLVDDDDDGRGVRIRDDIDLAAYALTAGREVTNATVQEMCVMQPSMKSLDVSGCWRVGDAALWAIGRHCGGLEKLVAAECECTRVGLRALSLGCPKLAILSLERCAFVDDAALTAIAAGCPGLRSLSIKGCGSATDDGIASLARGCRGLTKLDASGCARVGEFGDRGLLALGRYCSELEELDLYGCAHAQDGGVIAVAFGCERLRILRLTGCREITGASLEALAAKCALLEELCIVGCERLRDRDLERMVAFRRLERLDASGCPGIGAKGLGAIATGCPELVDLKVRGCARVGDEACEALASSSSSSSSKVCCCLRTLDLSGCNLVSEKGISAVAKAHAGLAKLDVTSCARVSRHCLWRIAEEVLEFAEVAKDFVGLTPKPNADALREEAEKSKIRHREATQIERVWRGAISRLGVRSAVRRRMVVRSATRFQACARGAIARSRVREISVVRREIAGSTLFAALWRGYAVRQNVFAALRRANALRIKNEIYAARIQRYYRGFGSRKRTFLESRCKLLEGRIAEARIRAVMETKAIRVQQLVRGIAGRRAAASVRASRDLISKRRVLELRAGIVATRVARGARGRRLARARRAGLAWQARRWRCARRVEAAWRGRRGRLEAKRLREARRISSFREAATRVQATYRAGRARFLATIAAAMEAERFIARTSLVLIQSAIRRALCARRARRARSERAVWVQKTRAAGNIQRVLRGHYGRTAYEIARRLDELRDRAAPLYRRLDVLRVEARDAAKDTEETKSRLAALREDSNQMAAELAEISRLGRPVFWDTARLTGYPQRFETKFLEARFEELLDASKSRLAELEDLLQLRAIVARDKERLVREVRRELAPLADGLAERARESRVSRLRERVRPAASWCAGRAPVSRTATTGIIIIII